MASDRRSGPRVRLAFPVLLDGPFGIRRCLGRDLSSHGIFVETDDLYALDMVVRVTFSVPDGSCELTSRCEVRHLHRVRTRAGLPRGVGLAFVGFEVEADDLVTAARRIHA